MKDIKTTADAEFAAKLEEMRAREALERDAAYAGIAREYGDEVADALRAHMSIYDVRFYLWLADLYYPGEYDEAGNPKGGGFYYSNSARDNEGYLIDVESTGQALGFLASSGMLKNFKEQIPERMQKEMVAFALSLQDPEDGYFYHPQWGKNISIGRQSRDTGWATGSVILRFGYQPYWNAPNGVKGIYGEPGRSTADQVEQTGTTTNLEKWPERLRTLENWENYLRGYESEIHTRSYSIGHTVAEQGGQIKQRDAEALANGEPTGYVELTRKYFDGWQNPENGLWEDDVTYNSINGLMKISAIYVSLGLPLAYPDKALRSAARMAALVGPDSNGKQATGSVDVYNPWIAISRIFKIMSTCGRDDEIPALRAELVSRAAEMIRVTTDKTLKFRKEDGSYGYTWTYSPKRSQDAPVAVPETVEGDVNGGTIALVGVTNNMLVALGISGISIYAPSDFEVFIKRAMEKTL